MSRALVAGGVRVLEVTLRTPVALEAMRLIRREVPELRYRRARGATTVYRLCAGDAPPMTSTAPTTPPPSPSPELAAALRAVAAAGRDLDGDVASEALVARAVHLAHAAGAGLYLTRRGQVIVAPIGRPGWLRLPICTPEVLPCAA